MKVKNAFGETRYVPGLGREVQDGEVVEVGDDELASYLEGGWEPADKATVAAHQHLLAEKAQGRPGVTVGTLKKATKPAAAEAEGGDQSTDTGGQS